METLANSSKKDLSQLILYMVNLSSKNAFEIANFISKSEFSELISAFKKYFFFFEGFNASVESVNDFTLKMSELLTFAIYSYNLLPELDSFSGIVDFLQSSKESIFSSLLKDFPANIIEKFLTCLHFDEFFSYLKSEKYDKIQLDIGDNFKFIYESFLFRYNKKLVKKSGSYFTPQQSISFIIRSIEQILIDNNFFYTFKDKSFIFMDPACGTGPFLLESHDMIRRLIQNYNIDPNKIELIGSDINIVSYLLAKQNILLMKLNHLENKEIAVNNQIFSINPLESMKKIQTEKNISKLEVDQLQEFERIKHSTNIIPIIFGNPPYSAVSNNSNDWINNLLKGLNTDNQEKTHNYFEVDGESINEKKSGWLYDDYIKFIRLSHYLIDKNDAGILSFVSNNAFLTNPSFRGLRCQLLSTFNSLYILDLHGNKIVDNPPSGIVDENIFNIIQGNCIFIFIKNPNFTNDKPEIFYSDIWGSKQSKLSFLSNNMYDSIPWKAVLPQTPFYNFFPEDLDLKKQYETFWSFKDIFIKYGTGLITSKDSLTIQFTKQKMLSTLTSFTNLSPEEARDTFSLGLDTENWKVTTAQQDIRDHGISEKLISTILYRPFDERFTYFTGKSNGFHGRPKAISESLFHRDNLAIISARTNKTRNIDHFFISSTLTEAKCAESSTQSYIFPLLIFEENQPIDNINPSFIKYIEQRFNLTYLQKGDHEGIINSLEILSYIYAVTHSPSYRNTFKDFFMYDFPKIPIVDSYEAFKNLAELGALLVKYHSLNFETEKINKLNFEVISDGIIRKITLNNSRLFINKSDCFSPVNDSIFNFTVGGYKVLYKWLMARKGFRLTTDQIMTFNKIVFAIQQTNEIKNKIDQLFNSGTLKVKR